LTSLQFLFGDDSDTMYFSVIKVNAASLLI